VDPLKSLQPSDDLRESEGIGGGEEEIKST
jgi:hypothetical protein